MIDHDSFCSESTNPHNSLLLSPSPHKPLSLVVNYHQFSAQSAINNQVFNITRYLIVVHVLKFDKVQHFCSKNKWSNNWECSGTLDQTYVIQIPNLNNERAEQCVIPSHQTLKSFQHHIIGLVHNVAHRASQLQHFMESLLHPLIQLIHASFVSRWHRKFCWFLSS